MLEVRFVTPSGSPDFVRDRVFRLSGLVSNGVTSCILEGPPLHATMTAMIPPERVGRVTEVAHLLGVTCDIGS